MNKTLQQSSLSTNKMKLSVTKGTVSQKAEVINQEKLFCWPESYNVKHIIDIKRPWGLRNCTKKKKKDWGFY